MTAQELIAELSRFPPETPVYVEHPDSGNAYTAVEVSEIAADPLGFNGPAILIEAEGGP